MKIKYFLLILLFPLTFYAQDYSRDWKGYFSYLDIKDISQGESKIYVAAENAVFTYDTQTNEIDELTTINGLSGETISSILYVEENSLLLIGFENGLMQVYLESSQEVISVVDILDKPTIPPTDKRINHFSVYNSLAYISTNYGVSVYDTNALEFGDTYFFGANGSQLKVNQTTVFQDNIYAATAIGIKKANVDNPNLIDFQQWQTISGIDWIGVASAGEKIYVMRSNSWIYELVNTSVIFNQSFFPNIVVDFRAVNDNILVGTNNSGLVYDQDLNEVLNVPITEVVETIITSFTFMDEGDVFFGTEGITNTGKSGFGILKANTSDLTIFEEIHPNCPISNDIFNVTASSNNAWLTYGDHTVTYNAFPLKKSGYSHLKGEEWINIPYDSLFGARNLTRTVVNPLNPTQVFISSFYDGLLEVNDDVPTTIFNASNSTFESSSSNPNVSDLRNKGSIIDNNNVLWCTNAKRLDPLKSYDLDTGEWRTYDFSEILVNNNSEFGYTDIAIDQQGIKWIGGYKKGIIGYNSDTNELKSIFEETQNMPSGLAPTVEIDEQNIIWIGTSKGLRVIYNTEEFFENPNFELSEIIVLDDGIARELLFQQFVTDIEIDGANNKWISTLDTGVYYFSSDGQETIYHFTKSNSPIPSNNVLDVALDETNGIVYIATDKGLVSFNSETSVPDNDLDEAYVYPNPVRPNFNINDEKIKIKGITGNVNIKITDIEGNLVTEAESRTNTKFSGYNLEIDGGTALWNGKNMSNRTVATGVYMVMISDLDSFETKVLKLMVVR